MDLSPLGSEGDSPIFATRKLGQSPVNLPGGRSFRGPPALAKNSQPVPIRMRNFLSQSELRLHCNSCVVGHPRTAVFINTWSVELSRGLTTAYGRRIVGRFFGPRSQERAFPLPSARGLPLPAPRLRKTHPRQYVGCVLCTHAGNQPGDCPDFRAAKMGLSPSVRGDRPLRPHDQPESGETNCKRAARISLRSRFIAGDDSRPAVRPSDMTCERGGVQRGPSAGRQRPVSSARCPPPAMTGLPRRPIPSGDCPDFRWGLSRFSQSENGTVPFRAKMGPSPSGPREPCTLRRKTPAAVRPAALGRHPPGSG